MIPKTSLPDIAGIYNDFIESENKVNTENRYVGKEHYFGASGTNMCIRKHWFRRNKIEESDATDIIGNRRMRLGTIQHNDLENALGWFLNNQKNQSHNSIYNNTNTSSIYSSNIDTIDTEGEIILPELNVRGFYDAVFKMKSGEVFLYDFKTINGWSYKLKFGRDKKPAKVLTHETQLATYGMGVKEKYGRLDAMFLLYYHKDNSSWKEVEVPLEYMIDAKNYWLHANDIASGDVPPPKRKDESPMQKWECGYCNYETYCEEN